MATPGVLGPVLCFPAKSRHGQTGTSPAKVVKDWSTSHMRRLGKLGLATLEKAHGRISSICTNNLMKGGKKIKASHFEWYLVKMQEATSTNSMQEILEYINILIFK